MPKLHFRYGTMNSAKTASLLMMAYTYENKPTHYSRVCVMKPQIDTRFGHNWVTSRAGMQRRADIVLEDTTCVETAFDEFELSAPAHPVAVVLVDECQFLSVNHVEALRRIALRVNVFCFGLRTDYRGYLFTGSRRLMELADTLEEVKTTCTACAHKAVITAKFFLDNAGRQHFIHEGSDAPDLGAEDKYTALCFACWHERTSSKRATITSLSVEHADGGVSGRDTPDTCSES